MKAEVTVWTDGGCLGNPGPGGYGVILLSGEHRRELSGGRRRTTNNRMELLAAVTALGTLRFPCRVTLHSDSKYLVESMTKAWVPRWRAKGWVRPDKTPTPNRDLWELLLTECARHTVSFRWLKGHAGHAENERCDELSQAAARSPGLPVDEGYEAAERSAVAPPGLL